MLTKSRILLNNRNNWEGVGGVDVRKNDNHIYGRSLYKKSPTWIRLINYSFNQLRFDLNEEYILRFEAKHSKDNYDLIIQFGDLPSVYDVADIERTWITSEWKTYEVTFTPTRQPNSNSCIQFYVSLSGTSDPSDELWLRNLSIAKKE